MIRQSTLAAMVFAFANFAVLVPFVGASDVLPLGFGMLSLTSMALALVLAARWTILDHILGGPDKSYGVHRWLGIFAFGGGVGHWLSVESAGFWARSVVPALAQSAEDVAIPAVLGLVLLSLTALLRALPYRIWKLSHFLMGPVFLLGAFHAVFVASPMDVGAVPWIIMAAASALGTLALVQVLLRKLMRGRRVTVARVTPFEGGVDLTVRAYAPLGAFRPGQFATLARAGAGAEAHPFTIAGGDAMSRRFVIRAAGGWTARFARDLRPGDTLHLGRSAGRFLPQTGPDRRAQLWVAGGVGITPFLAALEAMQPDHSPQVTLIWCIRSRASAGAIADIEAHAARLPQLRLLLCCDQEGARLTHAGLVAALRDLGQEAEAYLCGPEGMKVLVARCWRASSMTGRLHSERFDFRGAYGLTDLARIGKPSAGAAQRMAAQMKGKPDAPLGS